MPQTRENETLFKGLARKFHPGAKNSEFFGVNCCLPPRTDFRPFPLPVNKEAPPNSLNFAFALAQPMG